MNLNYNPCKIKFSSSSARALSLSLSSCISQFKCLSTTTATHIKQQRHTVSVATKKNPPKNQTSWSWVLHTYFSWNALDWQQQLRQFGICKFGNTRLGIWEYPFYHIQWVMVKCCLMSSDVSWHIREELWPMPKHGSINLYVHGNQKAR